MKLRELVGSGAKIGPIFIAVLDSWFDLEFADSVFIQRWRPINFLKDYFYNTSNSWGNNLAVVRWF